MQTMTTTTPGPWNLEARGRGIAVFAVFGKNDQHVAKVDGAENAQLIAAAPDLLVALRGLLAHLESWKTIEVEGGWIAVARDAIAKAEGKSSH